MTAWLRETLVSLTQMPLDEERPIESIGPMSTSRGG
jgi:hypothetical protein